MRHRVFLEKHKQNAFTLIEMMIVIAIVSILAAIAIPSFRSVLFTSRISTATNALHAALLFTRSEAIKRGLPVTICRSENPSASSRTCSTNANTTSNTGWGTGWIIFVDMNSDGVYDPAANPPDVVVKVEPKLMATPSDGSIIPVLERKFMTYGPTGQSFGVFQRFEIKRPNADTDASHDRYICIKPGGRVSVQTTLCSS